MQAMIKHDLLLWAVERAHIAIDVLSKKLSIKEEKLQSWLEGEELPTFKQAQKLANALQVPFGYLFLSEPPKEQLPVPDLRTIRDDPTYHMSANFKELLYDLDRKQRWYREYILENGAERLDFIGKFSLQDSKESIVDDIRAKLQWNSDMKGITKDNYLTEITKKIEELGILVMRSSYIGSNTRKSLSVQEFRGLAISDPYAPLIYVNTADAKSAQIFTLSHELAHLWIGESGISDLQMFINFDNHIEKLCNEIAAELLVPEDEFKKLYDANQSIKENCILIADTYHVSFVMALKRAYDLKFISFDDYKELYEEEMIKWEEIKLHKKNSGGDYYKTAGARISKLFSHSIISATLEGKLLYRDAAKLLNIKKMSTFEKYIKEMGIH
jgi:Zn-dependent peptidase ImmA (M78 family)